MDGITASLVGDLFVSLVLYNQCVFSFGRRLSYHGDLLLALVVDFDAGTAVVGAVPDHFGDAG